MLLPAARNGEGTEAPCGWLLFGGLSFTKTSPARRQPSTWQRGWCAVSTPAADSRPRLVATAASLHLDSQHLPPSPSGKAVAQKSGHRHGRTFSQMTAG